jgi:hypothetical protein
MAAERPTTHGVIVSGWREGGRERAQGIACLLPSFQPARYRNTHHLGFNGVRTELLAVSCLLLVYTAMATSRLAMA